MQVRLPFALTLIHEPHGLHLYDAGELRHWEGGVLSQQAFALLLCFCDRWRDRNEVVEFLAEAANASPEAVSATLDYLVEQGLLATDGDLHHAYAGDYTAAWHGYGWEDPFWYHFHTNSLPWMDYGTDPQGTADKDLMQRYLEAAAPPDTYKVYPEVETVPLARVTNVVGRSLSASFEDEVGQTRARGLLALRELSWLTQLAYGQTAVRKLPLTGAHIAKTSPSGGSRHPTEVYPVILDVDGLRPGVYHYNVREHSLEVLHTGRYHEFVRRHVIRHRGRPTFPVQVVYLLTTSKFRLNPLFRVRFGPPVQCDLLLGGASVELPDYRYLQFMACVAGERSFSELSGDVAEIFAVGKDHADRIVVDLMTHKLLTPHDRICPELPAVKHWVDRGWLDGLILHLRSRDMVFADSHAEDPEAYQDMLLSRCLQEEGMPAVWKEYPDRPHSALPAPGKLPEDETFEAVLLRRRSNLPWQRRTIDLQTLSDILHYANIETRRLRMAVEREGMTRPSVLLNSAFSALETYCFALAVDGLTPGVYHYDPRHHGVTQIRSDLRRDELDRMCTGQGRPRNAACAFVISAVWQRYMFRYRHPRAYRTLLINVAELGHKYILLATALRFNPFLTPTLHDQYADSLLGVDGFEEAPLYVVAIG